MTFSTRVLRFKMKDKHAALLRELAREVNFVWNFVNELSLKVKPSAIADIGRMLGKGCYRLLVGHNFPAGCHKERLEGQVGGAIFQAANVTLAFESERGNMSNFRGERSVDRGAKKSNE
jgi:hypothetical protein